MKKILIKWLHKIIDARVNEILNQQNEAQFYETEFLKQSRAKMIEMGYKEESFQINNIDRLLQFRKWYAYHQSKKADAGKPAVNKIILK